MFSALIVALALQAGQTQPPAPPRGLTPGAQADAARLRACEALAESEPEKAYEEGRAWVAETPATEAKYCLAAAAYALGRPTLAAQQFEAVAAQLTGRDKGLQAGAQSDLGNAWLIAGNGARALEAFNRALAFAPQEAELFLDRARAYAYLGDWRRTEEDLNAFLDQRPIDPLGLRLRAEARLQQGALELAWKDIEAARVIEPYSELVLDVRGRILQAKAAVRD